MGSVTNTTWVGGNSPSAFDIRSDVRTTPTPAMLAAIAECTLNDDVFREDTNTSDLEAQIAQLTGKEAGLFVLSGTMGNQVGLRVLLTQGPHGVLADHRSHIILYEAGGVSAHTGATVKPIVPANGVYLTLEDIQANVILSEDVHSCPTRVISLENTLNGMIMPLSEVRRIAEFARSHSILMHCDGARLWEAVAAGAGSMAEFCAEFDTVTLCLSKGLGAPIGSVLAGSKAYMDKARWFRKMMGGGTRQPGLITAAARVAIDETFGKTADGQSGLLPASHATAKKVEALWTSMGGTVVHPVQTNMCWTDLAAAGISDEDFIALCKEEGLVSSGGRIVTHYQVSQREAEVLPKLENVFKKVFKA